MNDKPEALAKHYAERDRDGQSGKGCIMPCRIVSCRAVSCANKA